MMARQEPEPVVELRAVDGRVPGRRGRATRDRLLKCTAKLLEKTSYRDITVIDIAQCAGTSPATFYQYFQDVNEAIAVLAGAMAEQGVRLTELIASSKWRGRAAFESSLALVDGFLDLWEEHRAVLRVVDLATLEGDLRFQNIRTRLLNQVTNALQEVISEAKRDGHHPRDLDPTAQAASIVSMLAHVASHRYGFEFWGIKLGDMRFALGRIVAWSITGRRPTEA
jgi:AcrR family transcriptional regulator